MKTILVTGGAGFIGSHLCEKLIGLGYKVINIDNFNDYYDPEIKKRNIQKVLKNENYILIEGDIRDSQVLTEIFTKYNIDAVVHLAAIAGVRNSLDKPQEYIDIDINGTVNLLELCKKNKIEKFVFASSSSVYGTNNTPFREDDNVSQVISPYAASKLAAEIFCRVYNSLYGIPIVCLRFFTVYGPRQRPEMAIHNFTRLIFEEKEVPIFGKGESVRDYTYIDDIVDGIINAIDLKCDFEIINLGNSNPIRLNELINIIEKKTGKLAYKKYMSVQKGDMERTCADVKKAETLLNFKPKTKIEPGIEKFIQWYKNENKIY